ncbi:hypothetical protein M501DRAFT_948081 [Patellaria atrata CBS 101060]|uniref:Early meiotic induction protein 1 n=1 Tax=Patellaria atrata CBS 101060 TaxID=1346257 RepID=A0A9P4SG80_9PEZI|nr:hypothetical protein M501DRAFT_948081 [Patellaria atrata CBS 101060]
MGWWWSSDPQTPTQNSSSPSEPQPIPSEIPSYTHDVNDKPTPPPAPSSKPLTRDEIADAELQAFLDSLTTPSKSPKASSRTGLTSASDIKTSLLSPSSSTTNPAYESSLYPTTLSCRNLFDNAYHCQSLGGQFASVYRHGSFRSCSEHWSDFWFCMRTKSLPEHEKAALIRDHYRKKAARMRMGATSEDVWEPRRERMEGAFARDPDLDGVVVGRVVKEVGAEGTGAVREALGREGLGERTVEDVMTVMEQMDKGELR